MIKVGNKDEAIKVLIEECKSVNEIISLSVKFGINDDQLWD